MNTEQATWIAHSRGVKGEEQSVRDHLSNVEERALQRCPSFLQPDTRLAAVFHDFGKYSKRFRRRLLGLESGLDHWAPGAHLLLKGHMSDLAAAAVHAHHVGLGKWGQVSALKNDLVSVEGRTLTLSKEDLRAACTAFLADGFDPESWKRGRSLLGSVGSMLDARMVLSALVDADYTDTAHHKRGVQRPEPPVFYPLAALDRLNVHIAELGKSASTEVLEVRTKLREAAQDAAGQRRGLFTLEAPTGTGKTLAMLEFALRQMSQPGNGLRRIIVVLPFLSILDETVREYRTVLGDQAQVLLEHHSLAEWRRPLRHDEDENGEGLDADQRAAAEGFSEDWQSPVIVTTTVQLFESLFTDHPSTSRKLCSVANSIILVDEVQTLPRHLLSPTVRALSRLAHEDYGCTVVLSTATQPLLSRFEDDVEKETQNVGWKPISIVSRSAGLYERTRRYDVDWTRCGSEIAWKDLANEICVLERVLCIVNTKKDARHLTELLRERHLCAPVLHLSTNMCAAHRRSVLQDPRVATRTCPGILISTQCVEAGVNLDFPVVYRALAGLDSIVQAAGRCNRAGLGTGEVRVFLPENARYPGTAYQNSADQTLSLLRMRGNLDPQDPGVFDEYFEMLYSSGNTPGTTQHMEQAILERDFPEVARLYRLIEHRDVIHVLVPWPGAPDVPALVTKAFFRDAQPFIVDANRRELETSVWLGQPLRGTEDWYTIDPGTLKFPEEQRPYSDVFGLRLDMELPII